MPGKGKASKKKEKVQNSVEKSNVDLEKVRLKIERDNYALKLRNLGRMIINEMPKRWMLDVGIGDCYDAAELKNEVLMEAAKHVVCHKKEFVDPLELRLANAEESVSYLTHALHKLRLKCSAYENGLKDIVKSENLTYIKDKVATLRVIAGERCHCIEFHNEECIDDFRMQGVTNREDDHAARILENLRKLQIQEQFEKKPGETKLEDVNSDVMLLIAKEMNQERVSRADWRTLADLVGVDCEKVKLWMDMQVKNPAQMVLDEWMKMDNNVTINELYNHLISPGIRSTLLCNVIRGYYDVL